MRSQRQELAAVLALIVAGIALYLFRWLLFPGATLHNEMWRFLVGDVAFLFLQIALVTLLVDRLLRAREKRAMLRKLNMVIGAFFSQLGTTLLGRLAAADKNIEEMRASLIPEQTWDDAAYASARATVLAHKSRIDLIGCDLNGLKELLVEQKPFLLNLLGNQSLLEHEAFTELLWAVTHLAEELEARASLENMPAADTIHISGDVKRAYTQLVLQWLEYVRHLQDQYPYLFSLAIRVNPLDPNAHATISE